MQQASRLLAICVFGLGFAQAGTAEACLKFDRAAEMAVIKKAITSPATQTDKRTALEAIHAELRTFQKKEVWTGDDGKRVGELLRNGMALVGKQRIIYREPEQKEKRKTAKQSPNETIVYAMPVKQAAAEAPLLPSCG